MARFQSTPPNVCLGAPDSEARANRMWTWLVGRWQRRVDRSEFNKMLKLDAHMLRDIGVTREDVEWAARLPRDVDAACALRRSVGRR